MDHARFTKILKRPQTEGFNHRYGYPEDFPTDISVSTDRYTDPEFFELEKKHVFGKSWMLVAHGDQLREPGSYLRLEMMQKLGHPIILVRGKDDKVRAFYNSCPHRGGPLVQEDAGSVKSRLVCKYHAWTFGLDGRLIGYPEPKNFPDNLRKTCSGLRQVACDTWGELIFVRLGDPEDENAPSLQEYLEPAFSELATHLGPVGECKHLADFKQIELDANWKLPGDGNIECYHVNFVHRDSVAENYDCGELGEWLFPNGHSSMLIFSQKHTDEALEAIEPSANPAGQLGGMGTYNFLLFPNLVVVMMEDMAVLVVVYPNDVNSCTYYTFFVTRDEPSKRTQAVSNFAWNVLLEDLAVMPETQASMRAPGIDKLLFQYQERRLRYVHEQVDKLIGPENIPEHLRVAPLMDPFIEEESGL